MIRGASLQSRLASERASIGLAPCSMRSMVVLGVVQGHVLQSAAHVPAGRGRPMGRAEPAGPGGRPAHSYPAAQVWTPSFVHAAASNP